MMISVSQSGPYRVDEDWAADDPDPEAGIYDPEAGRPTPSSSASAGSSSASSSSSATAAHLADGHNHGRNGASASGAAGRAARASLLKVDVAAEPQFFNPSRIPKADSENAHQSHHQHHATTASASYSFAAAPAPAATASGMPPTQAAFGAPAAGASAGPNRRAMLSPHEAMKQVHQARRPLASKMVVNSSSGGDGGGGSTHGAMGSSEAHRAFASGPGGGPTGHPGNDIIWQGCYLWKIPYSSNKVPRVRWVQSVHDVSSNGGRGVYLKWHDPKNTRKPARSLALATVAEIVVGQKTNAFFTQVNKRGRDSLPPVALCFSLICNERTVDLAATSEDDYRGWVEGLRALLGKIRHQPPVGGGFRTAVPKALAVPAAPAVNTPRGASLGSKASSLTPGELRKVWQTTLFDHCRHNRLNEVREVLNDGCDVDLMERGSGDTALMVACRKGRTHIVKLCLERGAKNDPHPQFGQTALQAAISHGHAKCAKVILDKAKKHRMDTVIVNHADPNKDAPLHIAARLGNMRCLECLLEHGADYTLVDSKGRTPLHVACAHNQVEVATVLVELAGDLDVGDHQGNTPLHIATAANGVALVKLLLQTAADPRCMNESGKTPLDVAQALRHHGCEMAMREGLMNVVGTPRSAPFFSRCLKPGESPPAPSAAPGPAGTAARSWHAPEGGTGPSGGGGGGGASTIHEYQRERALGFGNHMHPSPRGGAVSSPREIPQLHPRGGGGGSGFDPYAQSHPQHAQQQQQQAQSHGGGGPFVSRLFEGLDVAGSRTSPRPSHGADQRLGQSLDSAGYHTARVPTYSGAGDDTSYGGYDHQQQQQHHHAVSDGAYATGDDYGASYNYSGYAASGSAETGAWTETAEGHGVEGAVSGSYHDSQYGSAETNYYGTSVETAAEVGDEWTQDEEGNWCKLVDGVSWVVHYTDDGDPYYLNSVTGESQWEEPLAENAEHHDYGNTYWAEAEAHGAEGAGFDHHGYNPGASVAAVDEHSSEVYPSNSEGALTARQLLRARLAKTRNGVAGHESQDRGEATAGAGSASDVTNLTSARADTSNLTRAQRVRAELARGRAARKNVESMQAEIQRLKEETIASSKSGGEDGGSRAVRSPANSAGDFQQPPLGRQGSARSAWGEESQNTGRKAIEGKEGASAVVEGKEGAAAPPRQVDATVSLGERTKKYERMRKMGIPAGAIRHKMKQDGVPSADIAAFFKSAKPATPPKSASPSAAPAAAAAAAGGLKGREDMAKYFKMKKLGLPAGAIRQKMQKDGISAADMATFFGEKPPAATVAATPAGAVPGPDSLKGREDMAKYFKMKKLGLPAGAIRQKMQKDGISTADAAAFFGEKPPAAAAAPGPGSLKDREDMAKYFKMKKLGLPDGAIRQKMQKDGITASDISAFFGEHIPIASQSNGVHVPRIDLSVLRAKQTARRAEMETDRAMSKYFKMQKMGIPMGAIRNKMQADKVSAEDIAAFCGDVPAGPPGRPATLAEQRSQQARHKLKKLHWKKLDSTRAQNSLWGNLQTDTARSTDLEDLAQHFGQKTSRGNNRSKKKNGGSSKGVGGQPKRLLDGKRARNIEIGLAQFRAFARFEDLGVCVEQMDESQLHADRLETLLDIAPTALETRKMNEQLDRGLDQSSLGAAERFHLAVGKVPRFREKVRAFLFKSQFTDASARLRKQSQTLREAVQQIISSKKLTKVLETVLSVGNLMNSGTHAGDAVGITLDSLLKLTSTKSHDNKMTVLDYVVMTMLKSEQKSKHTTFPQDLSRLRDAPKCSPPVLKSGLQTLARGLKHMRSEAEKDSGGAVEGKGGQGEFSAQCQAFLDESGQPTLAELEESIATAEQDCGRLREHFGEDAKCDVVRLFATLEKFSSAFAQSVKKHTERQERQRRMRAREQEKQKTGGHRRASRSPERSGRMGGRRKSRSPSGRRRSRSVEGKSTPRGGASEKTSGGTGGPNLLAAIMAKGGLRGLKQDISLKATASPGTRQRHEVMQTLMGTLIQMGHSREDVKSIAERLMRGR